MAELGAATGGRVAAAAVRVRRAFVEERFGAAAAERYLADVSPQLRSVLGGGGDPDAWVDFRWFVEANVKLDTLFGRGDLALVRDAGHFAALHNAGVWRSMFEKGVDPPKFVEIAGGLWHKHYDSGALVRTVVAPEVVHMEIRAMPRPHRAHCLSVIGWIEGVFELRPGTKVIVDELSCRASRGATCELRLGWAG